MRGMVSGFVLRVFGVVLTLLVALGLLILALIYVPNSPLPTTWNPITPLEPTSSPNLLTRYKLNKSVSEFSACQTALDALGVKYSVLANKEVSEQCHIRNQVQVRQLSTARITPLKTKCGTALRLAMWEYHYVQPAAQKHLGYQVNSINQLGSYSCRPIRSMSGSTQRMSEHATANAVDISGFQLASGKKISLLKNWTGSPEEQKFLRDSRDGGCKVFRITLSPEYNALHADHFHFDQGQWTTCK